MKTPASRRLRRKDLAALAAPLAPELRVLVLAPTANDAELTAEFLSAAGVDATTCATIDEVDAAMRKGCGALLLAEESLDNGAVKALAEALGQQPPWSDIPITLITSEGDLAHEALRRLGMFGVTANVTLLERPFHPRTLISTVDVALRSRRRQYQIRDLIAQSRDDARHLEFVLRAGGLGAWRLQWDTRRLVCSDHSISHDMRQPLRAMEGYAQALIEDHGASLHADATGYLDRIRVSAVRLDRLIQDVLSYSRVSRRNVDIAVLDLDRIVRETIDTYPPLHGVKIEVRDPLGRVRGHEVAMVQCISNLLGNAVKFAAPRRPLQVKVRSERRPGNMLRLWIEDNGIGVRARDRRRIFDMFVQVHEPQRFDGTGIGLTIVRKAVERMSGRVGVQSTIGKGSRFWIELPSASP